MWTGRTMGVIGLGLWMISLIVEERFKMDDGFERERERESCRRELVISAPTE